MTRRQLSARGEAPGVRLSRSRLASLLVAALSFLAIIVFVPASHGALASGPAPRPVTHTVISDVHADAISTFWENEQLVLAAKADTPSLQTRYEADDVWFHVDDESRVEQLPPTYDFVAPAGSTVWLVSEAGEPGQLWPGFSTESVPAGILDDDATTLRLVGLDGPGELEVWQTGAFGNVARLWSSDEDEFSSFTRARGHLHANWAFTAAGTYRLTVEAEATVDGSRVVDSAVYTFVVGPLPEQRTTSTVLFNDGSSSVLAGTPVDLFVAVSPLVEGYVELRSGGTVLGHAVLDEHAEASLQLDSLPIGTHSITATFVPEVANLLAGSTSDPVEVRVVSAGGTEFTVAGVEPGYEPGDTLEAHATGLALEPDQRIRWQWRAFGSTATQAGDLTEDLVFRRVLTASDDGYELSATVWQCAHGDARCGNPTLVAHSDWVAVAVAHLGGPVVAELLTAPDAYIGDEAVIRLAGRDLAAGERLEVVRRDSGGTAWQQDVLFHRNGNSLKVFLRAGGDYAVRAVRDGLPIAQSAPIAIKVANHEVQIAGVHGVYRPGAALQARAVVLPDDPELHYRWSYRGPNGMSTDVIAEGVGVDAMSAEIRDLTLAHDGGALFLAVLAPVGRPYVDDPGLIDAGQASVRVSVQDVDPGTQLFQFQPLAGHYHQGNPVHLVLGADPAPSSGDRVLWQWQWPRGTWTTLPGASGLSHSLTAEQALHGVQVRATLTFGGTGEQVTAGPVTILVDDHGAPARQQPTVSGRTSVAAFDTVTLTRALPDNGGTALTEHRWERLAPGSQNWAVIAGTTGAELSFTATPADDGAQYRVSLLKPTGEVAYGPSPAVTLGVVPPADGLYLHGLSAAYSSGRPITLSAVVVPDDGVPATYRWSVKRADQAHFHPVHGLTASTFRMTAEQALDGAQIKAERVVDGAVTATSAPVVVAVDDHGPAPQTVSIAGQGEYAAGETATLTANVSPRTVLDRYQWYITAAGSHTASPIEGANGVTYSFRADAGHHGAALSVAVVGEDGEVVYGPSAAHPITVHAAGPQAPPSRAPEPPKAGPTPPGVIDARAARSGKKRVSFTLSADGRGVSGPVAVRVGAKVVRVDLVDGRGTVKVRRLIQGSGVKVRRGKVTIVLGYAGDDQVPPFERKVTLKLRGRP